MFFLLYCLDCFHRSLQFGISVTILWITLKFVRISLLVGQVIKLMDSYISVKKSTSSIELQYDFHLLEPGTVHCWYVTVIFHKIAHGHIISQSVWNTLRLVGVKKLPAIQRCIVAVWFICKVKRVIKGHRFDCEESRTWGMMTSSNGNIFRVTGLLCGEFTGYRWIPRTQRPVTRSFDAFFDLRLNKRLSKQLVIRDAIALIMTSL